MGPCAVLMGPGAGWSRGCVIGGPCRRGAAGAGRRDSGEPAAAAITAATARGLGSRPPARDLGSSLEKVSVPCSRQRGRQRSGQWSGKPNLCWLAQIPFQLSWVPQFPSIQASPPAPQRP